MKNFKKFVLTFFVLATAFCFAAEASPVNKYLITAKGAGGFVVGGEAPASNGEYEVKEETRAAEEGNEGTVSVLYENGVKALEIIPGDSEIFYPSITVFSEKYHTDKGAKVGATIDDLVKMYPKYSLYFTYISDMFAFEAQGAPEIQFILDGGNNFTGKQDLYGSDMVKLSPKDFKPKTKVTAIRIHE
jgi:hypothetical protein